MPKEVSWNKLARTSSRTAYWELDVRGIILLAEETSLAANAEGEDAAAGNLTVTASTALLRDPTTELSARAGAPALSGEIVLNTPDTDLFSRVVLAAVLKIWLRFELSSSLC